MTETTKDAVRREITLVFEGVIDDEGEFCGALEANRQSEERLIVVGIFGVTGLLKSRHSDTDMRRAEPCLSGNRLPFFVHVC